VTAPTASRSDAVRLLSGVDLFMGLPPDVIERIAATAVPRRYARGTVIFSEGDPGSSMLVLAAGMVVVYRVSSGGERAALTVLRPPEVLGELALLDGTPRSATVEAVAPTMALAVSRDTFVGLLREQPRLVEPVLRHLGAMIRRLTDQAADSRFLDLAGRVSKVLLRLAGMPLPGSPAAVEITQGRLADMAGGSRQSVNQALGQLGGRGLVRVEGRRIVLLDIAGLRRRAGMNALPVPSQRVAMMSPHR
jgi:CRP/FNR family cyclic AMP-dependent transcriptional regulator